MIILMMTSHDAEEMDESWVIINCPPEGTINYFEETEVKRKKLTTWKCHAKKFWQRITICFRVILKKSLSAIKRKHRQTATDKKKKAYDDTIANIITIRKRKTDRVAIIVSFVLI